MKSNLIKMMLAVCLFLVVVLALEWQFLGFSEEDLMNELNATPSKVENARLPILKLSDKPVESYTEMVERPLFIQGRSPVVTLGDTGEPVQEQVSKIDNLSLEGIYSIKEQKYALFKQTVKDAPYKKIPEGESVMGWSLLEIQSDRVVMEGSGQKVTLELRKPKPKELKKQKNRRSRRLPLKKTAPLKPKNLEQKIKLKS